MDRAVRNVVHEAGIPLDDALRAASTTPAAVIGLDDRGVIEPGRRADLVALDPDSLAVCGVWAGGRQVG
jgi:N-acetylglucosamine-6-phosphate deacetylase